MKEESKLIRRISFDLLDAEILESYLKEMAAKGWILDEIGTLCLYFKKSEEKDLEFFVDITTKDMLDTYEMPKEEYLNSHKENNLEHICNNKRFQVFINHGNKYPLERKKVSFLQAFSAPIFLLFLVILCMFYYIQYVREVPFVLFISNNMLILCSILLVIILGILIAINIMNIRKYIRKKQINNNFNSIKNFKIKNILIKCNYCCTALFILILLINSSISSGFLTKPPTKSDLPVALEDLDAKISSIRECSKEHYSSVFATYNRYMDSTYEEEYKTKYNDKTKEKYGELIMKDLYDLDYTVFETKYINIMNAVIDDELKTYDSYKKTADKELLKNWGAKDIYSTEEGAMKIIISDNCMVSIYTNIDLDKEKIDFIKRKILK